MNFNIKEFAAALVGSGYEPKMIMQGGKFMKKILIFLMLIIFSCAAIGCSSSNIVNTDQENNSEVTALVEEFGQKLQLVSLVASANDLENSIQENYSSDVTPGMLQQFLNDPADAPGRVAASFWPDRIDITSSEKTSDGAYQVKGNIIEVTSKGQAVTDTTIERPITLEVDNTNGKWLIASVEMGEYQQGNYILYINGQYGFYFQLPQSWSGFTIITDQWQGYSIVGSTSGQITETGEKISIRNPQWTQANPWQDIPIMVFTTAQWNEVQQQQISVGAAPIPPSELGSNSTYVFALPARYNYSFFTGWQEVGQILQGNPLKPFNLQL